MQVQHIQRRALSLSPHLREPSGPERRPAVAPDQERASELGQQLLVLSATGQPTPSPETLPPALQHWSALEHSELPVKGVRTRVPRSLAGGLRPELGRLVMPCVAAASSSRSGTLLGAHHHQSLSSLAAQISNGAVNVSVQVFPSTSISV